jgi:peptide/nickel transport system substrate-binding protein
MPPTVPFYDAKSQGLQYNIAQAKAEMAKSSVPKGFTTTFEANAGALETQTVAQVIQAAGKPLGIKVNIIKKDANAANTDATSSKYPGMIQQYWTMDIADPDELVSFAVDIKGGGANSFYTSYDNPAVVAASKAAQREFDPKKRQVLYSKVQRLAAQDAFMAFLYNSPFRYASSSKVQGFLVYPTGNYHMEDVWLQK